MKKLLVLFVILLSVCSCTPNDDDSSASSKTLCGLVAVFKSTKVVNYQTENVYYGFYYLENNHYQMTYYISANEYYRLYNKYQNNPAKDCLTYISLVE